MHGAIIKASRAAFSLQFLRLLLLSAADSNYTSKVSAAKKTSGEFCERAGKDVTCRRSRPHLSLPSSASHLDWRGSSFFSSPSRTTPLEMTPGGGLITALEAAAAAVWK